MTRRRAQGFTLIEVLIAVFVLSVGMLGVAALQVTSKRTNFDAVQRTTATLLAQELLERIRANSAQMAVYTADGAGRTIALVDADAIDETDCVAAACTAGDLAMYDLYEFSESLRGVTELKDDVETGGLLTPTACVVGPNTRPGYVTVSIAWRGMNKLSNPTSDLCGAESGRYDSPEGDEDAYRRVLFVNTYVD